jgi:hypothetical protein
MYRGVQHPHEEEKVLKTIDQKSVAKHRAFCNNREFFRVKIFNGYLEVEKSKYEKNRDKYNQIKKT